MSVTEPAPIQQIVPDACTTIENYPHEGILFYDVTTLLPMPRYSNNALMSWPAGLKVPMMWWPVLRRVVFC